MPANTPNESKDALKGFIVISVGVILCLALCTKKKEPLIDASKITGPTISNQTSADPNVITYVRGEPVNQNVTSEAPQNVQYHKLDDVVTVGHFTYRVSIAKYKRSIGDEYMSTNADGLFLVVGMTLRNDDNEQHTLTDAMFKLTDAAGNEYESSSEGTTALMMLGNKTLFLKGCNPHVTKEGWLVFEVPKKATYYLHLSGGFWTGETTVVKLTN